MIRGITTIRISMSNPSKTSTIFFWNSRRIRYSHLFDRDKLYLRCQDKYPRYALQKVAILSYLVLKNLHNTQKEILYSHRVNITGNGKRCPVPIRPASKIQEWRI